MPAANHSHVGPFLTALIAALTLAVHGGVLWQKVDNVERQITKALDEQRGFERRLVLVEARNSLHPPKDR